MFGVSMIPVHGNIHGKLLYIAVCPGLGIQLWEHRGPLTWPGKSGRASQRRDRLSWTLKDEAVLAKGGGKLFQEREWWAQRCVCV